MIRRFVRGILLLVTGVLMVSATQVFAQLTDFGAIGIGEGQTLELNVVAWPPDRATRRSAFATATAYRGRCPTRR
jgi:hypothetical protein